MKRILSGTERRFLLVAASLLASLAVIFLLWRSFRSGPPRITESKQLTFTGQAQECCLLEFNSPIESDGRRVYYTDAQHKLHYVAVAGGEEEEVKTDLEFPVLLHLSHDGSTLLVRKSLGPSGASEAPLWLLPANGGAGRHLGDLEGQDGAFAPDEKTIVIARGDSLFITDETGAQARKLLTTPGRPFWPRWAPDGKRLRYTVVDPKSRTTTLWEATLNGAAHPLLAQWNGNPCCGTWSSDGKSYLFINTRAGESQLWWLPERLVPWSRPQPKPIDFPKLGMRIASMTVDPLDRRIFVVGQNVFPKVFAVDLGSKRTTSLLAGINAHWLRFSPDGKWAAFTKQGVVWRCDSKCTQLLQLTSPPLNAWPIAFSPDGSQIALVGRYPGQPLRTYLISREGGSLHELHSTVDAWEDPNWSLDGESIIFGEPPHYYSESGKSKAIYIADLKNGNVAKLKDSDGWFSPRLSPDGRAVAALSLDMRRIGLFTFKEGAWRVLAQGLADNPFWSLDGKWLYFNDGSDLWRVSARSGDREHVLSLKDLFPNFDCFPYSFAPTGSVLVNCVLRRADIYELRWK